jgi:DNA-binding transcriptional LysR family regulator
MAEPPSIRELEVLGAMIATRKTVAAAHALGISQPAVSRALAALEERVGRTLFLRDGGRLQPTADAFALEAEARPILAAMLRLSRWPADEAQAGVLRIAAAPTLAQYLLPDLVARFRGTHPGVVVNIEIGTGSAVVSAVADRRADVGLVDTPGSHPGVRLEPFREAAAHCILPAGHRLAGLSVIEPGDLAGEPMIALARRFPSRIEAERIFAAAGVTPRIVAEAVTSSLVVELVRKGVGFGLINPFPVSLGGLEGLEVRPFSGVIGYTTMLLFPAMGAQPPAARAFADELKASQPEDGWTTPIR